MLEISFAAILALGLAVPPAATEPKYGCVLQKCAERALEGKRHDPNCPRLCRSGRAL